MLNKSIKTAVPPKAENPRRAFETAMAQLQHGSERSNSSQTPIYMRPRKEVPPLTETQMVADAARALAQLWNVSPRRHSQQ
jgi:hypothetical protein